MDLKTLHLGEEELAYAPPLIEKYKRLNGAMVFNLAGTLTYRGSSSARHRVISSTEMAHILSQAGNLRQAARRLDLYSLHTLACAVTLLIRQSRSSVVHQMSNGSVPVHKETWLCSKGQYIHRLIEKMPDPIKYQYYFVNLS